MRINEFSITRYGPLPSTGKIKLEDFNLFWGKNEDGKTLTIDAMVKLLLGKNIKDFENIDRVEETPEGYVILGQDDGEETKLSDKKDLTKVVDLTTSECRNIFIIRDSNLSVGRESNKESQFYTEVTDRLTGLRTVDIVKITKSLENIGKLTPTGRFRTGGEEQIGRRIDDAKELTEEAGSLIDKVKVEEFDKLEEELVRKKENIKNTEQEITNFDDARKREQYEKAKSALDRLENALDGIKTLDVYDDKVERTWRDSERDIEKFEEDKERLIEDLHRKEEYLKQKNSKFREVYKEFKVLDDRKKKIDEEIRSEIKSYETKNENLVKQEVKNKLYNQLLIIFAVLLGLSLIGFIINSSMLFVVFSILFFISGLIMGILKYIYSRVQGSAAADFEKVKTKLSKFGLSADDIDSIHFNIQGFDEQYRKSNEELQEIKREQGILKEAIEDLRDNKIPEFKGRIDRAKEAIDDIKIKSKDGTLEEYKKKLELKQSLAITIGEEKRILKNNFNEDSSNEEDNIAYWRERTRSLENYKDKANGIEYSEAAVAELQQKKDDIIKDLEEISEKMKSLKKELGEIQRKANDILKPEDDYFYCETSADLVEIKDRLDGFIEENEANRENVLEAIAIFEEIEAEEKAKVSELFGEKSPISKYFNTITGDNYTEVKYNQENEKIEVKRKDGKLLEADKLSGGAYDQLYFSIRLALGDKLLKGKKGFFILDDPFIKADPNRLMTQIGMLKTISEIGWQIIYFSAKGEIREALEGDIENGGINFIEVQGINFGNDKTDSAVGNN